MLNEVLRLTKGEISTKTILKIYSCLFCKSENVTPIAKINKYKTGFVSNWYIRCNNCLARGSEAKTQNDAIAYWNREPQYLQDNSTPNLFEQ